MLAKDPQLAGGGLRGRDEQLERAACAHGLEVDESRQQIAQRVELARVDLCGREVARPTHEQLACRRELDRIACSLDHDGGRHQFADLGPEAGQGFTRACAPALEPAIRQDDGVHRAGTAAAQAFELHAFIVEQSIEHAPGECAMGATPLQRQVQATRGVLC